MSARRAALAAAFLLAAPARAAVPEPAGFRMDHYRGDVPATLHGATVVTTPQLAALIATARPVLIDVLPAAAPPPDSRPNMPRMPLPHRDIPGSRWLPETGRGALPAETETKFRAALRAATGGNMNLPVVFYCLSKCWMSWNAARRALAYGYTNVIWYPDGADGWQAAGHDTVIAQPSTQ
jgi:PQQ-dependent catabolism-associated CXXCW motif protein